MPETVMVWSPEQEAIFEWFRSGSGNLVVEALAGSGKTTTIVEGTKRAPEPTIFVCAFNKRIAEELQRRLADRLNIEVKTLHSSGYQLIRQQCPEVTVDGRLRMKLIRDEVYPPDLHWSIQRLIDNLHTKTRELLPLASKPNDLIEIALEYQLTPERWMEATGWKLWKIAATAFQAIEEAEKTEDLSAIDYADMLFLPLRHHWTAPTYDLVVVDEAQDMTEPQLQLALGLSKGRIVLVGDSHQAIYGFRGADSGALGRLKAVLSAQTLGLQTTYRCGTTIVAEAQKIVPAITAREDAQPGEVAEIRYSDLKDLAGPGDFVLSRSNAPLVPLALYFLREGKRCRVQGKDIGKNLTILVEKIARSVKAQDVSQLLAGVSKWESREIERAKEADKSHLIEGIQDKAETIRALSEDLDTLEDLKQRLEFLFDDGGEAQIICSTVHKAKGLEADTVFVLADTLKRRVMTPEEDNIKYVAITRAKERLVWVHGS